MILVGIGANLPSEGHSTPRDACDAALAAMDAAGLAVVRRSRWYRSAPVPASDQPWFVNGVAWIDAARRPDRLLAALHRIEAEFGRVPGPVGSPRPLDLDLLDVDGRISADGDAVRLPHPRLHERAFVLLPLAEVAPAWRHPVSGLALGELIAALGPDQVAHPLEGASMPP